MPLPRLERGFFMPSRGEQSIGENRMDNNRTKLTLSLLEANHQSGLGQHTLRAAVRDGTLAAIKLGQRRIRIRIRPESLNDYLKSLEGK